MGIKSKASILIVILLSLSMIGCSVSSVVTDIQIAVTAIDIAAPIVAVFAGPGAALVLGYMTAATNGLNCVLAVADTPGATVGQVSAAIATCLPQVILPVLPAGVPPNIAALINVVAKAIANIIQKYGPKSLPAGVIAKPMKLTFSDHRKIRDMQKQLGGSLEKLSVKK